jgi:hypothetical protein
MNSTKYTVHGVLAGAYKGKSVSARELLTHASADGGITALCGKVKADALCDELGEALTCPHCEKRIAKL